MQVSGTGDGHVFPHLYLVHYPMLAKPSDTRISPKKHIKFFSTSHSEQYNFCSSEDYNYFFL